MSTRTLALMVLVVGCWSPWARATDPNPLEDAYWRFEEGTPGNIVAQTPDADVGSVLDTSGNANHMRAASDLNAPTYTAQVPAAAVPLTGAPNLISLYCDGAFKDVYTITKHINNPIVTAFTLEASFNADLIGDGIWRAVVSKESLSDDFSSDAPPLALKVRGDTNHLMIEIRDKSNNLLSVDSIEPIQAGVWYHAAVVADTQLKLYLKKQGDSEYVLQASIPIPGTGPLWQGTDPAKGYDTVWNIGKGMWARAIGDNWMGFIDEVRLSNEALPPEQFLWAAATPGDFDGDGSVNADDQPYFEACDTGPDVPYGVNWPGTCTMVPDTQGKIAADMDHDGDVDQDDFGQFQRAWR